MGATNWCKVSSLYQMPTPDYWTWTKKTPQKKWFFWSSSHKIEVKMITLIEMPVTKLWSRDHIYYVIWIMLSNLVGDVMDRRFDVINFISKCLYFKKADSRKVKRIRNYDQNAIYICISWYSKIWRFSAKKCWCQQNSRVVSCDS